MGTDLKRLEQMMVGEHGMEGYGNEGTGDRSRKLGPLGIVVGLAEVAPT